MKPLDLRTFLIIAALAAPLVGLAIMARTTVPTPGPKDLNNTAGALSTPDGAAPMIPSYAGPPRTLDEARSRTRTRLEILEKMTPEQWDREQKLRASAQAPPNRGWEALTPEQKLKRLGAPKPQPRLPDLKPETASPQNTDFDKAAPASGR